MLTAAVALGGIGFLAALGLGIAAKVFYVHVDPLILEIEEALPGANCGGCGFAGCASAAVAMAKGQLAPNGCVGGGAEVAVEVASILGVEITEAEPEVARVGCRYPVERADVKYTYDGAIDCRAAMQMSGGPKECPVGCIGLGSCVKACPFDALSMGPDGLPVVNEALCTGCGTCVRTCPVGIMNLTSVTNRILGEYKWSECTAPCQRTCPAGINVPEQIYHTAKGDYLKALTVIKERNPLPLICGRICPRPCEFECRRNLSDEPVAINFLKRFVSDYERRSGRRIELYKAPATNRKAAIIGGGAQGLTAANFLARLGHTPVIFEAEDKLGGLLRTVIPENRLPRDVLDWEIEGILELGVEARTGQAFGREVKLSGLFDEGFEAVFIATGGWDTLLAKGPASTPNPALPGIYLLLPLTLAWAAGRDVGPSGRVVVVATSKQALETARNCLKQGAEQVTVLFRRSQPEIGLSPGQLAELAEEGIDCRFAAAVTSLRGRGDSLTQLTYREAGSEADEFIAADAVVVAAGRVPEMIVIPDPEPPEEGAEPVAGKDRTWKAVAPYREPGPGPVCLFGDLEPVRDYLFVVEAVGAGRRAAASIHAALIGQDIAPPERMIGRDTPILDVDHVENLVEVGPRQQMPEASPEQRLDPKQEIELGFDELRARKEARRCLNCGLICYQRTRYGEASAAEEGFYTLQDRLIRVA